MDQESNGAPRIIDNRGKNRGQQPLQPPQFEELTEEQLEALRAQALQDDSTPASPDRQHVLTAFVVMIGHDNTVQATNDLSYLEHVEIAREASFPDMYSACAQIQKDISNQEVAIRVTAQLRAQAAEAQEQLMAAQMRQKMMQQGQRR